MSRALCLIGLLLLGGNASAAERVVLVAGGGERTDPSPAQQARLNGPFGIAFDAEGNTYGVELAGNRVWKIDTKNVLATIAGTGNKGDRDGPALQAEFNGPHSLVVAPNGDIYIADTWNNRVRKLDPRTGRVSTFAGTGEKGFSGDGGPATQAQFGGIYCIAFDPSFKRLYLADLDNRRIRVIELQTGIVTTVAGNGEKGVPQNGAVARSAPLVDPRAVAVDSHGNVYILERSGHALRVVDADGRIRTVAGTGQRGLSGDGGPARQAQLNGPKHLCVDANDNVILADTENHVIRKYLLRENTIVRLAGTGRKGTAGIGGPPDQIELNQPHGVTLDSSGVLFISDSSNNRVLKIVP